MIKKLNDNITFFYKIVSFVTVFFMIIVINYNNFFGKETKSILKNIFIPLIIFAVLFLVNKLCNKLKEKDIFKINISLLIFFGILEVLSVLYFRVKYNWDFKWLMDISSDLAKNGHSDNLYYLKIFPHNISATLIITCAKKIFFNNDLGAYVLNIVSVFLAAFFSMLSARKINGEKLVLNTIILLIICSPFYLYTPIVYTDTLSVLFPIATFYFYLLTRDNINNNNNKSVIYFIIMTIIAFFGYCIKPVAAIVYVAVLIELLFSFKKEFIKYIFISLIIFVFLINLYNMIIEKFIIKDNKKNDSAYPYTHWIMMGMNKPISEGGTSIGWGAYSDEDVSYTANSGNYQQKVNANIDKIKERISNYRIVGYIKFLFNKFKYIWNDGSFYVLNKIGWDTLNKESLIYNFIIRRKILFIF